MPEPTTISSIISGMTDVVSVVGSVFNAMVANPVIVFFLSASLLTVGVKLFKRFRKAAGGA